MVFATGICAMLHKTAASAISVYCTVVGALCNSYTMAARDFADIYTQSPRAAGPRVYMSAKSQAAMVQVIYITWGTLT